MIYKSNLSDLLSFDPFHLKGALTVRQDLRRLKGNWGEILRQSLQCPLDTSHNIHNNNDKEKSLYNRYTIEAKQLTGSVEHKAPTSKKTKIRWLRISSHKK